MSALIQAINGNNFEQVQHILSTRDIDIEEMDENGKTALIYASIHGYTKIVQGLLKAGASVDHHNRTSGTTALMYASYNGHDKVVQKLLEAGADVDYMNESRQGALSMALMNGHEKVVRLLLSNGARTDLVYNFGTARKIAQHFSPNLLRLLKNKSQQYVRGGASGQAEHADDDIITKKIKSYLHNLFGVENMSDLRENQEALDIFKRLISDIETLLLQKGVKTNDEITSLIESDKDVKRKVSMLFLDFYDKIFQHTRHIESMKRLIEDLRGLLSGDDKLDISPVYQKYKTVRQIFPEIYAGIKKQISRLVSDERKQSVRQLLQDFRRNYPHIEQRDLDEIKKYILTLYTGDDSAIDPSYRQEKLNKMHVLIPNLLKYLISQDDFDTFNRILNLFPNLKIESKNTLLLFSAHTNQNILFVNSLLDHGANINAQNQYKQSPLIFASASNNYDMVHLLLSRGAGVDLQNGIGYSALMYASQRGYRDIAERLIEAGADVNLQDIRGKTALMIAISSKHLDVVNLLLEKARPNITLTDKDGKTARQYMINNYDNLVAMVQRETVNRILFYILHYANDPMRTLLRNQYTKPKQQSDGFNYALMKAIIDEDGNEVKQLLRKGDPNIKDPKYGMTALMVAITMQYRDLDIIQLLLNAGANLDLERTSDGATAISLAHKLDNPKIMALLDNHITYLVNDSIIKSFGLYDNIKLKRFNFFDQDQGDEMIFFNNDHIKQGKMIPYLANATAKKKITRLISPSGSWGEEKYDATKFRNLNNLISKWKESKQKTLSKQEQQIQQILKGLNQQGASIKKKDKKSIKGSPEDKVIIEYFDTVKSLYAEIDALYHRTHGIQQEIKHIHEKYYSKFERYKSSHVMSSGSTTSGAATGGAATGGGGASSFVSNQRQIRENRQRLVLTYAELNSIFSLTPKQSIEKQHTNFSDHEIGFIPTLCRRLWLNYVRPNDAVFLIDTMNIFRCKFPEMRPPEFTYKTSNFNSTFTTIFNKHRRECEVFYKNKNRVEDRRCVFIWLIPKVISKGKSFFDHTIRDNRQHTMSVGRGIGSKGGSVGGSIGVPRRTTDDLSLSIVFHPIIDDTSQLLSKSRSMDDYFILHCEEVFRKIIDKISTDQFLKDLRTTRQSKAMLQTLITDPDKFIDSRFADALDPALLALFVKKDVLLFKISNDKFRQYSRKSVNDQKTT